MIEIDHTALPPPEPARAILASHLLGIEEMQRKRFSGRGERISTECGEIDDYMLGGGCERGIVLGISAEAGEGRLVSCQFRPRSSSVWLFEAARMMLSFLRLTRSIAAFILLFQSQYHVSCFACSLKVPPSTYGEDRPSTSNLHGLKLFIVSLTSIGDFTPLPSHCSPFASFIPNRVLRKTFPTAQDKGNGNRHHRILPSLTSRQDPQVTSPSI